ncbi:MAG: hypothetical protein ACEY3D_07240 [Rickettsia sp.]|uniref:hypothetical protein n=1 Tax=Rickettsia sp. TaxID=789 RepID=UPI00397E1CEC
MDTQIVIARSEATWQSRKIIKKFCKSEFFFFLASSKLTVFPRNDDIQYPRNNASRE